MCVFKNVEGIHKGIHMFFHVYHMAPACRTKFDPSTVESFTQNDADFRIFGHRWRLGMGYLPPLMTGILIMGPYKPLQTLGLMSLSPMEIMGVLTLAHMY